MCMAIFYLGLQSWDAKDNWREVSSSSYFVKSSSLGTKVIEKFGEIFDYEGELDENDKACGFGKITNRSEF